MKNLLLVLLLICNVSFAQEAPFESCRDIEDTVKFLECVEAPEFTEQYVEPPEYDIIQEDYYDENPVESIEQGIVNSVEDVM